MNNRLFTKVIEIVLIASLLVSCGCSAKYKVMLPRISGRVEFHTPKTLKSTGKAYEVVGMAHCENWNWNTYWVSNEARLQTLVTEDLVDQARQVGADAIVNVDIKAENHYEMAVIVMFFPLFFGWEEGHAGALLVKYKDLTAGGVR